MIRFASRLLLLGCTAVFAVAAEAGTPADTVEAFHQAIDQGDADGALLFMGSEATVFEQGFVSATRADYAKEALPDAIRFAKVTHREVIRQEAWQNDNIAWVLVTTMTTGDIEGRKIALQGTETVLLRKDGPAWKITHLHDSAHEVDADAADGAAPSDAPAETTPAPAAPDASPAPAVKPDKSPSGG